MMPPGTSESLADSAQPYREVDLRLPICKGNANLAAGTSCVSAASNPTSGPRYIQSMHVYAFEVLHILVCTAG